jgi:hypothetical protein
LHEGGTDSRRAQLENKGRPIARSELVKPLAAPLEPLWRGDSGIGMDAADLSHNLESLDAVMAAETVC